jgi:small subunit ribosomal protein S21
MRKVLPKRALGVGPYFKIERLVILVPGVKIRDGEGFEGALRRFKKQVEKGGVLSEVKKREHFEKPSVRLKKKSIAARKRSLKKNRKGDY